MKFTPIFNGNMAAAVQSTGPIQVGGRGRRVCIRGQWPGTGSPSGFIGAKLGAHPDRMTDFGRIDGGNFDYSGAQPAGSASAGSIYAEFETGAEFVDVYYTASGGGAGNTGLIVDVSIT